MLHIIRIVSFGWILSKPHQSMSCKHRPSFRHLYDSADKRHFHRLPVPQRFLVPPIKNSEKSFPVIKFKFAENLCSHCSGSIYLADHIKKLTETTLVTEVVTDLLALENLRNNTTYESELVLVVKGLNIRTNLRDEQFCRPLCSA